MEINKLPSFVLLLILVGMLLGVGILTFGMFASADYKSRTVVNESVTWPAEGANVSLAHGNLTSLTSVINGSSDAVPSSNYTVYLSAGKITNLENSSYCTAGDTCYVNYVWNDYYTPATVSLNDASTASSAISSTWLSLIITIAVLAIIIGLVIAGFAMAGRGR